MAKVGEQRMNLTALQRVDSKITEIIDNASQVALYKFNDEGNEWEKTEIEGTLFVYVRSQVPYYGFIVMNRLNTTNFIEPINSELEFQLQTPFLLYKNSKGSIFGVWFYNRDECTRVENILLRLSDHTHGNKLGRQRCVSESDANKSHDIMSLLSHAHEEYNKQNHTSKAPRMDSKSQSKFHGRGDVIKPTPVRASNGYAPENNKHDGTPLSLATIFAQVTASQKRSERSPPRNAVPTIPHRSISVDASSIPNSTTSAKNIMKHLMANPANKLEHIEKLQHDQSAGLKAHRARATSCSATMEPHILLQTEATVHNLELDIKEKLKLIPAENGKVETPPKDIPKPKFTSQCSLPADEIQIMTPAMFEMSFNSPSPQFHHFPLGTSPCEDFYSNQAFMPSKAPEATEVPLLSPLAFTKPVLGRSYPKPFPATHNSPPETLTNGCQRQVSKDCSLLLPEHLENYSLPSLTKEQLRESLVYLLKNDDDFLSKIHDAYAASLKAELSRLKT